MPIGGLPIFQQAINPPGIVHYQGVDLEYWADSIKFDKSHSLRLDGNVKVVYGDDTLTADHFQAYPGPNDRYLVASGHVVVIDPDGSFKATDIRVSWDPQKRSAFAKNVEINLLGSTVRAETAEILPEKWTFYHYYVTLERTKHPLFSLRGAKLVVTPGHNAQLVDSDFYVLGQRILGIKEHQFNLDPRATGLRIPTLEYRPGKGFGYNWTVGSIIDPGTAFQLHTDAANGDLPGYGAIVTKSMLPPSKDLYPIAPRSEFGLRFDFSYMENVLQDKPSDEISYLDRPRNAISYETIYNAGVDGRGYNDEVYSVPGSVAYEIGGPMGRSSYVSEFKLETIDSYRQAYRFRGEWNNSLELPVRKLSPDLFTMSRLDSGVYQSAHNYFWAKANESLVYVPNKNLTLGANAFGSFTSGVPEFDIDPLYYHNGLGMRADYRFGPRKISVLLRYDTQLGWFDDEFLFTQAMGPFEAFISHREYPGDSHFGVMLRVDQIEDLLTRRNWKRSVKTSVALP
jgi:hypothetical protein